MLTTWSPFITANINRFDYSSSVIPLFLSWKLTLVIQLWAISFSKVNPVQTEYNSFHLFLIAPELLWNAEKIKMSFKEFSSPWLPLLRIDRPNLLRHCYTSEMIPHSVSSIIPYHCLHCLYRHENFFIWLERSQKSIQKWLEEVSSTLLQMWHRNGQRGSTRHMLQTKMYV